MIVFNADTQQCAVVEPKPGTILENMSSVLETTLTTTGGDFKNGLPMGILYEKLRDKIKVSCVMILY